MGYSPRKLPCPLENKGDIAISQPQPLLYCAKHDLALTQTSPSGWFVCPAKHCGTKVRAAGITPPPPIPTSPYIEYRNCQKCGGYLARTNKNPDTSTIVCQNCGNQFYVKLPKVHYQPTTSSTAPYNPELRTNIVKKLGATCQACGRSDDIRILQIDHIDALDGKIEKAAFGAGTKDYYQWIWQNLSSHKYQVLCASCNQLKSFQQNETNSPLADLTPEQFATEIKKLQARYYQSLRKQGLTKRAQQQQQARQILDHDLQSVRNRHIV